MTHRWSGWPGAWCLDCGLEDADEIALAGPASQARHRYSDLPHTVPACRGCSPETGECPTPGSRRYDPYLGNEPGTRSGGGTVAVNDLSE